MLEPVEFHPDLSRREALQSAAEKYRHQAAVEFAESGAHIVARLKLLVPIADKESEVLRDEFCTEALSETVRKLRNTGAGDSQRREPRGAARTEPPWELLAPFTEGAALALGWVLESLSPVRSGATVMVLRHTQHGVARVSIHRNSGAPLGVVHTKHLDFMLMNGGGGAAQTEGSVEKVLRVFAEILRRKGRAAAHPDLLDMLLPHTEGKVPQGAPARNGAASAPQSSRRLTPTIDIEQGTISFAIDDTGVSRLALYDAALAFAARGYVFLTRPEPNRVGLHLKVKGDVSPDSLRTLARDATKALNQLARNGGQDPPGATDRAGLPRLPRQRINMDALLAELDAADPATLGVGFQPERGPGHENVRVLNVRGTGACNSECVFCIEKFNPTHRPMLNADGTRELILESAGEFDLLFFAAGEPTIHPKLFEYVELAKSVGFTAFGMSSHFRTFSDPRFALKILQAGFEYFDIALHAADLAAQLEVNPIGDGGNSLPEALKGLAILYRLADVLGIRISVTHKIVVSRMNVTNLEPILRETYDRGVRHFILQPVRSLGLAPELQAKLAISEAEIMPHLNELLRTTSGWGAVVKPYGFSRQALFSGDHVESETNRLKNIYGRSMGADGRAVLPTKSEPRPSDGRHWVEVRGWKEGQFSFAADGKTPVLDDALDRGLDLMFGCRMGSCGMCCGRLLEGEVDQSQQIFLTDEQVREGYVLMCQARPRSDVVIRVCSDEEIDGL